MKKLLTMAGVALMFTMMVTTTAMAAEYNIGAPEDAPFAEPTSVEQVTVVGGGVTEQSNIDRSKNSAVIPPPFGSPESYQTGSGTVLLLQTQTGNSTPVTGGGNTVYYFSARSGDMTVEVNSTMTTRQSIAIAQIIPQYRYTEGLGRRRLLTPDEVLRLPNDQLLIVIRGQKVLRAKKFDYTGHPYAKECVKASIWDYPTIQKASAASQEPVPQSPEAEQKPACTETAESTPPSAAPPPKPAKRRPVLYCT